MEYDIAMIQQTLVFKDLSAFEIKQIFDGCAFMQEFSPKEKIIEEGRCNGHPQISPDHYQSCLSYPSVRINDRISRSKKVDRPHHPGAHVVPAFQPGSCFDNAKKRQAEDALYHNCLWSFVWVLSVIEN
ncbi:MAG: hypothetical protein K9K63_15635 [Desulfotignum sp.]|nr:hypothetical protein [Desulfotignum sp.]MCF8089629.1 hypothetical protein [Desulfotignum sp.]MCF8138735.1 hypothetical protein [Desulfotignum sp.]